MALDDSKSESLWKQIEARKQGNDGSQNPHGNAARNGASSGDAAFVNALFKTLKESEAPPTENQAEARARLLQAIRSERMPLPQAVSPRKPEPPRHFEWNRQTLLIALLLLLLAIGASLAAWNAWQRLCTSTPVHASSHNTPPAILTHEIQRGGENVRSFLQEKTPDVKASASASVGQRQVHCD
jgi:hypothetical protein